MSKKKIYLEQLLSRGYDNPRLSDLSEHSLKEILKNEESFYKRNSSE
tara:strand:+ start:1465 stop:1605 length:141 start_codon:yes stop_codon:yes gene_type:complete